MARDNFSKKTIGALAERVGFLCSNPNCGCFTVGPHMIEDKVTRIGKAAHITAAAVGGPRYDLSISVTQRSSISNGIWLCSNCADLIDKDPLNFPASLLLVWKTTAEHKMSQELKAIKAAQAEDPLSGPYLEADLIFKRSMRQPNGYSDKNPGQMEYGVYVVEISNKPIIHWKLGWELSLVIHNNSSFPAINVSVEIESDIETLEKSALPKVNNIKPFESVKLKISFFEMLESSHIEADERLKKRIPESFANVKFNINYFDEGRRKHLTVASVSGQQIVNKKS